MIQTVYKSMKSYFIKFIFPFKRVSMYFETIKCEDYEIFNLDYHKKRVCSTIGLNIDLQEYIYPPSNELLRCKLVYDESGVLDISFFPYKKRVVNSLKLVYKDDISYEKKYLNREDLDYLFQKKEDADDIIIVKNSLLTDTSIANIALCFDGVWFTPKTPLLKGTTRARLLKEEKIFEKDIFVKDLKKVEKVALMNAMIDFDILDNYSFFT